MGFRVENLGCTCNPDYSHRLENVTHKAVGNWGDKYCLGFRLKFCNLPVVGGVVEGRKEEDVSRVPTCSGSRGLTCRWISA